MIKFDNALLPCDISHIRISGLCPHCKTFATYTLNLTPIFNAIRRTQRTVVAGYSCDMCLGSIPIRWEITTANSSTIRVMNPKEILRVQEPFDFEHVPHEVKKEIEEGLDCLSVRAYNGFAAMCRRAMQALCTNLGADSTSKVEKQIGDVVILAGLDEETHNLMRQAMLSGHDGSHPHLPEVDIGRAIILLQLLRDLTYQLYTRPGKIKEADTLRQNAIAKKKNEQ